ncbi:MAG: (Fe-S)-binding protein [bacterium]|nr:(Fe-S)-binding protein [bacterium]
MTEKKLTDIDEIAAVCNTCGNCLHACPVYNAEWVEPNSPRGKVNIIKALRDGRLEPGPGNKEFIYSCLLCGSCQHICTKGVQFVDMMTDYRITAADGKKIPFIKKAILFFYQSFLFKKFTGVLDLLVKTPLKNKFLIPKRRRADLKKITSKGNDNKEYDVLLFPGCVMTRFYPEVSVKIHTFLQKKGFSVVIPRNLECCGFPFVTQGWKDKFLKLMGKNKNTLSRFKFKYMVVPCGSCTMAFKEFYKMEGVEVLELTEFFFKFLKDEVPGVGGMEGKIAFHEPCHHLKSLGLKKEPGHFMEKLGDQFVPDDGSALCCGFGGIFSVGFPGTSKKILDRKEDKLNELGADAVVTSCPGCYMQLKENLPKDVKFFIDLFE